VYKRVVKLAVVEALRTTFDAAFDHELAPRRIDIEYPEDSSDWPALLVQWRGTEPAWVGIDPDIEYDLGDGNVRSAREISFTGDVEIMVLALTSGERDRLWDNVMEMITMGRKRENTRRFFDVIESHEYVHIQVIESRVADLGESAGVGTPWGSDEIAYEASLRFSVIGQCWADAYSEEMLKLEAINVYEAADAPEGQTWEGGGFIPG
jgi:hypothetical protein